MEWSPYGMMFPCSLHRRHQGSSFLIGCCNPQWPSAGILVGAVLIDLLVCGVDLEDLFTWNATPPVSHPSNGYGPGNVGFDCIGPCCAEDMYHCISLFKICNHSVLSGLSVLPTHSCAYVRWQTCRLLQVLLNLFLQVILCMLPQVLSSNHTSAGDCFCKNLCCH